MAHIPAERCLDIVELLADGARSMSLGDIAGRLGLPKSGAHRLLATLVELGWAEQDPTTAFYRLSMRLAIVGLGFFVATGLPGIGQPMVDRLAERSCEFARLAVVDGSSLAWVAHAQGARGGLRYQPGRMMPTVPLHATASGKAWLASMPIEQAVNRVLAAGFGESNQFGPNAIRSIEALVKELETTAASGYAIAVNEGEPGVSAVAAAIRPAPGEPAVGTISVAGPSVRMDSVRLEEIAREVVTTASELAVLWPSPTQPRAVRIRPPDAHATVSLQPAAMPALNGIFR
jgi:DNA-binding IclR family transcriptional regulator